MTYPTIKLERSTRADSRGFRLRVRHGERRLFTLALHHWRLWRPDGQQPLGFTCTLQLGPGAGYRGGRTAYLALRARGGLGQAKYTAVPFRVGFTRNANSLPSPTPSARSAPMKHDDLLSPDVLAAFGDVLAPTEAADTAARITAMVKRSVEEDARAEAEGAGRVPPPRGGAPRGPVGGRRGVHLATPAVLRAFVLSTEGDVTLVSKRTGERFTFEVTRPSSSHRRVRRRNDNDVRRYVKLRNGSERLPFLGTLRLETSSWRGRTYPPGLHVGRHCDLPEGSPAVKAAVWLFDRVVRGDDAALVALLAQADVYGEAV